MLSFLDSALEKLLKPFQRLQTVNSGNIYLTSIGLKRWAHPSQSLWIESSGALSIGPGYAQFISQFVQCSIGSLIYHHVDELLYPFVDDSGPICGVVTLQAAHTTTVAVNSSWRPISLHIEGFIEALWQYWRPIEVWIWMDQNEIGRSKVQMFVDHPEALGPETKLDFGIDIADIEDIQ